MAHLLRSRFLWKLYAGLAIVIFLTAGLVGVLLASSVERDTHTAIDRRLMADALRLRDLTMDHGSKAGSMALAERTLAYGNAAGTRLTVIRDDGVVLADSEQDPAVMDNHADRPEVVAARATGRGTVTRRSRTLGTTMRYLALRLDGPEGQTLGVVRAAVPEALLRQRLKEVRQLVALGAGLASLVAMALGIVITRRITRPLQTMTHVAEAMAAGDYSQVVTVDRRDELGTLARAFNTMSGRLREQLDQLTVEHSKITAVLGSLAEGVVAVDASERVVHMNQAAGDLLRVSPDTMVGRPIWEVTRIRAVSEAILEVMETAGTAHREIHLPGRADRVLELRAAPLRSSSGTNNGLGGVVLALEDVTQLRKLETVRQDFVANVSHELKTPITVIRGLVETMLDDPEVPADTRQRFLGKIHNQNLRLSRLVTDLLSLSRLEATGAAEGAETIDLRAAITTTVGALQPAAEVKGARIETQLPAAPVIVHAEPEAIREAVGNLLDNAVKYTPSGTAVALGLTTRDGRAVITVVDQGPGIALSDQERIFERFYRVDKGRSRFLGGTGLGLAIVKHIARNLGGEVRVESAPGAGSTFCISLPLA